MQRGKRRANRKEPFRMSTGGPVPILKGSLKGGEMINNTPDREKFMRGELISLFPVDDVIIR